MKKLKVGVLGATGIVGQRFIQLLQNHPWFEMTAVFSSPRTAGKRYGEATSWRLGGDFPVGVRDEILHPCEPGPDCAVVFSALPTAAAKEVEPAFAKAGYAVCSNAGAFRDATDVPLMIPEVNPEHLKLIDSQRTQRGWPGCIVTNPNCTTTHLVSALHPLHANFGIDRLFVVTMQALSGAGHPGVSSLDIVDNVIPLIPGEETKVEEREPHKLLGQLDGDRIAPAAFTVSAHCNRVPVLDGHLEAVSVYSPTALRGRTFWTFGRITSRCLRN